MLVLSFGALMQGIQLIGPRVCWHFLYAQNASNTIATRAMRVASTRMRYGTNVFLSRKAAVANSWAVSRSSWVGLRSTIWGGGGCSFGATFIVNVTSVGKVLCAPYSSMSLSILWVAWMSGVCHLVPSGSEAVHPALRVIVPVPLILMVSSWILA